MPTPESIDAVVDCHRMQMALMRRDFMADGHVSNTEALAYFHYQDRFLEPALTTMTTSWRVVNGIMRGSQGAYGPRVQRTLRELWARADDGDGEAA